MRESNRKPQASTILPCLRSLVLMMLLGGAPCLLMAGAQAQRGTTLVVDVAEFGSGTAIAGAEVSLPEIRRHLRSDNTGEARFADVPVGSYEIRVRHIGYAAVAVLVDIKDSARVSVLLKPNAEALDTVHVVASAITIERHRQFEIRRKKGIGRFIGPETLDEQSNQNFPVVATQHFPGLRLITGRGGQLQLASTRGSCGVDTSYEAMNAVGLTLRGESQGNRVGGAGSGAAQSASAASMTTAQGSCFSNQPCHVKLFLDDQPVAESDINIVRMTDLYGVEYYSTGNAPPRYQLSGAACGVMLLWTKAGNSG